MKFLIDTHVLLWWLGNDRSLTAEAQSIIADPANTIFVSSVTMWEIWLKKSLGKLELPDDFDEALDKEAFESLPLTAIHTRLVARLPWLYRDPFDRMLIAQARAENLTLLTNDKVVASYGDSIRLA